MVLCAIVGFVSYSSIETEKKVVAAPLELSCFDVVEKRPLGPARVILKEFIVGNHIASFDNDDDGKWNSVCVPLFPKKQPEKSVGYRAVLVHFQGVHDQEALDQLLATRTLEVHFWPDRQGLKSATHSTLAQQYLSLNFARSPSLHYGVTLGNPLVGEGTLYGSVVGGCLALLGAFIAIISGFFFKKSGHENDLNEAQMTNRAGLPPGVELSSGKYFDGQPRGFPEKTKAGSAS
ncbi:MAG: hypothetical protein ACI814_000827 [Mariniblastus sp.]|jgi:hypothetical protein